MDLAATLLDRLVAAFEAERDPAAAAQMSAYMRSQFPFVGLPAPRLRALARSAQRALPVPTEQQIGTVLARCWAMPEREYQYVGCDYLRRHVAVCSAGFLDTVGTLVSTKPWWDTVDTLAANAVGPLVLRYPQLVATMDEWAGGPELWLVRTALLHQLTYRERTDAQRLFRYCELQAGHGDFFIRKAIGWALRQYARTDPQAVRDFLARVPLSALSVREASKHL